MVKAGAGGAAAAGEPSGMNEDSSLDAEFFGDGRKGGADNFVFEGFEFGECFAQFCNARFIFRHEITLRSFGIEFDLIFEVEAGVRRELAEKFEFAFTGVEGGFDVAEREFIRVETRAAQGVDREIVETIVTHFADVFAVEPIELGEIEAGVVSKNLWEVE